MLFLIDRRERSGEDGRGTVENLREKGPPAGDGPAFQQEVAVPIQVNLNLLLSDLDLQVLNFLEMGTVQGICDAEERGHDGGAFLIPFRELYKIRVVLPRDILPMVSSDIRDDEHLPWG